MILRKHPAWPEKITVFGLVSAPSTASPSSLGLVKDGLLSTQSCSAVPNSATAPMDSSKENAQYDAARKAVSQTNLCDPLGLNQSQLLLPGFRMDGTTASAPLGHAGASRENLSTARPPMPQLATAPSIGLNCRPRSR